MDSFTLFLACMHLAHISDVPSEPEPDPPLQFVGPPKPQKPIENGKASQIYVDVYKKQLAELRAKSVAHTLSMGLLGKETEWKALHWTHRAVLLMLAGVEGDLKKMAKKSWQELPPNERMAITSALKVLKESLSKVWCLCE